MIKHLKASQFIHNKHDKLFICENVDEVFLNEETCSVEYPTYINIISDKTKRTAIFRFIDVLTTYSVYEIEKISSERVPELLGYRIYIRNLT